VCLWWDFLYTILRCSGFAGSCALAVGCVYLWFFPLFLSPSYFSIWFLLLLSRIESLAAELMMIIAVIDDCYWWLFIYSVLLLQSFTFGPWLHKHFLTVTALERYHVTSPIWYVGLKPVLYLKTQKPVLWLLHLNILSHSALSTPIASVLSHLSISWPKSLGLFLNMDSV
jgi:hypothetical protein